MKKKEGSQGRGALPVAFVNAERRRGLTRSPCCRDESRTSNTTQQARVSVLDALQQHGAHRAFLADRAAQRDAGGRNEHSVCAEHGGDCSAAGGWRVSSQRVAMG